MNLFFARILIRRFQGLPSPIRISLCNYAWLRNFDTHHGLVF